MQTSRRSLLGLRVGRVSATNETATMRTVQLLQTTPEILDRAPLVQYYGIASRPHPGCHAVTVMVGGEQSPAVLVIATNDARYHLTLAEGEVALHTDQGDHVWLKRGLIEVLSTTQVNVSAPTVDIAGAAAVNINGPAGIALTAPVSTINGDLHVTGDITDRNGAHGSLATLRANYNAHAHGNVQNGGGYTGLTNDPVP